MVLGAEVEGEYIFGVLPTLRRALCFFLRGFRRWGAGCHRVFEKPPPLVRICPWVFNYRFRKEGFGHVGLFLGIFLLGFTGFNAEGLSRLGFAFFFSLSKWGKKRPWDRGGMGATLEGEKKKREKKKDGGPGRFFGPGGFFCWGKKKGSGKTVGGGGGGEKGVFSCRAAFFPPDNGGHPRGGDLISWVFVFPFSGRETSGAGGQKGGLEKFQVEKKKKKNSESSAQKTKPGRAFCNGGGGGGGWGGGGTFPGFRGGRKTSYVSVGRKKKKTGGGCIEVDGAQGGGGGGNPICLGRGGRRKGPKKVSPNQKALRAGVGKQRGGLTSPAKGKGAGGGGRGH